MRNRFIFCEVVGIHEKLPSHALRFRDVFARVTHVPEMGYSVTPFLSLFQVVELLDREKCFIRAHTNVFFDGKYDKYNNQIWNLRKNANFSTFCDIFGFFTPIIILFSILIYKMFWRIPADNSSRNLFNKPRKSKFDYILFVEITVIWGQKLQQRGYLFIIFHYAAPKLSSFPQNIADSWLLKLVANLVLLIASKPLASI